eukprot:TRINITY_DN69997_c0_g1_i1.p1 TRINITY_DN69997_c0_g1~~TRINITY_DN69997_c0_g1_i1.p1  ORF type:complete len:593 (+),score=220.83 TRINITY_DN69997_c0_g1_i1:83-1780(+)
MGHGYLDHSGESRWSSTIEGGTERRAADLDALAVDFENVGFHYGAAPRHHSDMRAHKLTESHGNALSEISLKVPRGARVVLVGENGAGKSTLLETVAGKHRPQHGKALSLGLDCFDDTVLNNHIALVGAPWPPEVSWGATVESHLALERGLDQEHVSALMHALHIDPRWRIDRLSSGQKRRIQLLLGFLRRRDVLCLDECSTDIDVIERSSMLQFFHKESVESGVTVLYATHIFDGLDGWATYVVRMRGGRIVYQGPLEGDLRQRGTLYRLALNWIREDKRADGLRSDEDAGVQRAADDHLPPVPTAVGGAAVELAHLSYSFPQRQGGAEIFRDASVSVQRGSRVLVVGTNGGGKSTMLRILAGRHLVPDGKASIFRRDAFGDTKLHDTVAFSGDWWAAPPDHDTTVAELLRDPEAPRTRRLLQVLDVNLAWDMKRVSAGQRRRIQLLLSLEERKRVLLLDEVTADMDVIQREKFLRYLRCESEEEADPATVLYSSHIFEGLNGWPTHVMLVNGHRHCLDLAPWDPAGDILPHVHSIMAEQKEQEWQELQAAVAARAAAQLPAQA